MYVIGKRRANGHSVCTNLNIQKFLFLLVHFVSVLYVNFKTDTDWVNDWPTDELTDLHKFLRQYTATNLVNCIDFSVVLCIEINVTDFNNTDGACLLRGSN